MNKNNTNTKPADGAQSAERFTVKIYTENTFDGTGSHRALAEFHDCEGEGEKDAALKMLEKYIHTQRPIMKTNYIQTLINKRDEETDSAMIEALQARIDAAVDSLPASKKEDASDIDRLFASFK